MMDKFKMNAKALLFPALASVTAAGSSVVAFAAGSSGSPALELPKINITTEMLQPLVEDMISITSLPPNIQRAIRSHLCLHAGSFLHLSIRFFSFLPIFSHMLQS